MNDLVNKVADKTGVPADTVRKVLQTAAEYVKHQLPPQYASQVDHLLNQGGAGDGGGGGLAGAVGGLFGGS